jgi:hypothetical protein
MLLFIDGVNMGCATIKELRTALESTLIKVGRKSGGTVALEEKPRVWFWRITCAMPVGMK